VTVGLFNTNNTDVTYCSLLHCFAMLLNLFFNKFVFAYCTIYYVLCFCLVHAIDISLRLPPSVSDLYFDVSIFGSICLLFTGLQNVYSTSIPSINRQNIKKHYNIETSFLCLFISKCIDSNM